ncbi:MAG: hypothetical protein LUI14_08170 [Lachnospiraceae bacterium]|nr:hypothetical protein [Lachnospiraceae bacterium]
MKSYEQLQKEEAAMKEKLNAIRKEAKKAKKLEEQQAQREAYEKEVSFALSFVEAAKHLTLNNGQTFYDFISERMSAGNANA